MCLISHIQYDTHTHTHKFAEDHNLGIQKHSLLYMTAFRQSTIVMTVYINNYIYIAQYF